MNATDAGLREVDRLDVLVLVDNATDSLSTTPKHVVSEWTGLRQAGRLSELSGAAICCAHHGLSLLIRAHVGDETHTVLFDAGPEGATLRRNAAILGDRKSTRLNSSHGYISYAVFCLKKKKLYIVLPPRCR